MDNMFPFGDSIPDELGNYVRVKHYSPGTTIFTADDEAESLYYIQRGRIQLQAS